MFGSARIGFNADPDPALYLSADLDPGPGIQTNADPDYDPGQTLPVTKKLDFGMKNILYVGNVS